MISLSSEIFQRGFTMRRFQGGERAMLHRWNYRKIRGARPIMEYMVANIVRHNVLFRRLTQRET